MGLRKEILKTGLFSLIDAGLGHIYNGKLKTGLILYLAFQFIYLLFHFIGLGSFTLLLLFLLTLILFRVGIIIHSVHISRSSGASPDSFYRTGRFITAFIILSIIFNVFVTWIMHPMMKYESRRIVSNNMFPTFKDHDFITINNSFYQRNKPEIDNPVIYHPPHDPRLDYIGRIIGEGGDVIECVDGVIIRNNERLEEKFKLNDTNINFEKFVIPNSKYFILGDNRADSFDSRHFGFVDGKAIFGKPLYIYFSTELSRIGNELE